MPHKMTGTFFGVGVGPGDPGLLTLRAAEILRTVDVIFEAASAEGRASVAGSVAETVTSAPRRPLVFPMSTNNAVRADAWRRNAAEVADELRKGRHCAFITIGDPLIYSTCAYLLTELRKLLPGLRVEMIPGITSFQAAAAKLQIPLTEDEETLLIAPGFNKDLVDRAAQAHADNLVVLKVHKAKEQAVDLLVSKGWGTLRYAAKIGLPGETLLANADAIRAAPAEYLSLLVCKKGDNGEK